MTDKPIPAGGITRRSFLKTSAAVAGVAAAGSAGALNAFAAEEPPRGAPEEQEVTCVCGCNCQGTCSLVATVREGRMVNIRANDDLPYPAYERICNRGFTHTQRLYEFNRVLYPLKRKTWSIEEPHVENRGNDEWERLSWDEAAKLVADTLKYNIEHYGPRSNAILSSAGNSFAVYGGSFTGYTFGNLFKCSMIDVCLDYGDLHGLGQVTGGGWDFNQRNMSGDYRFARTMFVWDSNPPNSEPHNWHFIIEAKEAGGNLVVIDPTYTIAAAQATKWVPINPGTDPALGLAMINAIIENEWYDADFVLNKTVAPLLVREDNGHFLRSTDFGPDGPAKLTEYPYAGSILLSSSRSTKIATDEQVSVFMVIDQDTGNPAGLLDTANPALEGTYEVDGVKVECVWGMFKEHMSQYTPAWAAEITGVDEETIVELARMYALETPSTIYAGYHLYDNCDVMGQAWGCLAALTGNIGKKGASVGHLGKDKPYLSRAKDLFPAGLGNFAPDIPWLHLDEILQTGKFHGKDYPIRSLWNIGANPVGSYAAQKYILEEMLPKIPCIITSDLEFSDTVDVSDIVLPCTHYFEYQWIQGASHVPFIYMSNRVVEPIGEAKEDVDIFAEVAKYMDDPIATKFYSQSHEAMMRTIVDTPAGEKLGISYDNLMEHPVIADKPENWIHWEDQKWPTSSRRLEIYVENPAPRINVSKPIDKAEYRMPTWRTPNEAFDGSEQHKKYPLYHYCERTRWHLHTQYNFVPWLRELDPEPFLRMNPADAEARGIKDGEYGEAFNDRGSCVARVKYDSAVRPGMVSSPKGWNRKAYVKGCYQELTNSHFNIFHMNTSFDDTLVEVRKYEGEVR